MITKSPRKSSKKQELPPSPSDLYDLLPSLQRNKDAFKSSIIKHLRYTLARNLLNAKPRDWWLATCFTVRDYILESYLETLMAYQRNNVRRLYYLSLEYLMGRLLYNNLYNLGIFDIAKQALSELGYDIESLKEEEVDMGLGNGGLGRLATCFLDSLATLNYPAVGYGIHYEFGLFKQEIINCKQVEKPDNWLKSGNPWQIIRPEYAQTIKLYGRVQNRHNTKGDWIPTWSDFKTIEGLPWDIPIVGYNSKNINFLRLWESRASQEFDLKTFNDGGYSEAVRDKVDGENISKVLYPNDKTESGKELRLVQQYFFASCSLRDIIRRFQMSNGNNWSNFTEKVTVQLNDTHPAIAVPELMHIFVDEFSLPWEFAWSTCQKTFAYTNHTLLPEALEKWSANLIQKVLPRHLQIIYEINHRFLRDQVDLKWPNDDSKKAELSIIEESPNKMIRMAYLATVGSHSINGVAALHTELLQKHLFKSFYELSPEKFNNKTNGITPRLWLKIANPSLASLIDSHIGQDWVTDLSLLKKLEPLASDPSFQKQFMDVKLQNKIKLSNLIAKTLNIHVNPHALFDVQIKRLHEYKRQHLNLLHIVTLYYRLLHNPPSDIHPRVFIFGAKAAPGYEVAKDIIYMINAVAKVINNDPRIQDKLKVVFLPNYSVSLATQIIPAADLSEQISTAGKEASGTGNMKLALNGACTIGTLDGANVEILEEVGQDNIFIFGLTVDQVHDLTSKGYSPYSFYQNNEELRIVIDWLSSGHFTPENPNAFTAIKNTLLNQGDPFLVLADYQAYCNAQQQVNLAYKDPSRWAKMAILNTARIGKFSIDRTTHQYAQDIWNLPQVTF